MKTLFVEAADKGFFLRKSAIHSLKILGPVTTRRDDPELDVHHVVAYHLGGNLTLSRGTKAECKHYLESFLFSVEEE